MENTGNPNRLWVEELTDYPPFSQISDAFSCAARRVVSD